MPTSNRRLLDLCPKGTSVTTRVFRHRVILAPTPNGLKMTCVPLRFGALAIYERWAFEKRFQAARELYASLVDSTTAREVMIEVLKDLPVVNSFDPHGYERQVIGAMVNGLRWASSKRSMFG